MNAISDLFGFIVDGGYITGHYLWLLFLHQPWPSYERIFQSIVCGVITLVFLWKPRRWLEKNERRKFHMYQKKSKTPTTIDNQTASASIGGSLAAFFHR